MYLRDLGEMLKAIALQAKEEAVAATETERGFALGRLMGMHEVVALMQQQAEAFGITRSEIGLDGIVPERDLM